MLAQPPKNDRLETLNTQQTHDNEAMEKTFKAAISTQMQMSKDILKAPTNLLQPPQSCRQRFRLKDYNSVC